VSGVPEVAGLGRPVPDLSSPEPAAEDPSLCGYFTAADRQGPPNLLGDHEAPAPLMVWMVPPNGIKFPGDGEGPVRKHGTYRRRQYRKVRLARDTVPGDTRAVAFPASREGDNPFVGKTVPGLLSCPPHRRTCWIEAKIRCPKSFGELIASQDPERQAAEVHIRVALMNRFNALGTADIRRMP
jgi:hypothetical protein